MKKLLLLVNILMITSLLNAQPARNYFLNMPDSLTPLLSAVNKADFVDFLESDMKARVKNKFGNVSEMTDLDSTYVRIAMTDRSSWQLKVLTLNDSVNILCTVFTACAPVCDSKIRFFSTEWEELPLSDYLALPAMDNFFLPADSVQTEEYKELRLKTDMLLVTADFSEADELLTLTFTTPRYMEEEDAEKLKDYLRNPLIYRWEEGQFKNIP